MDNTRQAKDYYDNLSPSSADSFKNRLAISATEHLFARSLGWMSLGLGAVELWQSQQLGKTLGTGGQGRIFQIYGLREIGTGIGLLAARDPTPWVWARVAGDLLDLATLAPELRARNPQRKAALAATAFVAGAALVDLYCAMNETQRGQQAKRRRLPDQYQPPYQSRPSYKPDYESDYEFDYESGYHPDDQLESRPQLQSGRRAGQPSKRR